MHLPVLKEQSHTPFTLLIKPPFFCKARGYPLLVEPSTQPPNSKSSTSMSSANLPVELWREILELASGEDIHLHASRVSSLVSGRRWRKDVKAGWILEDIEEERMWRHSMRTRRRKALMLVCKQWALISTEFMYRTITLREPHRLHLLKRTVVGNSDVARWIKHLYIYEEDRLNKTAISYDNMDKQLIPIILGCNRLKTLSIEQYVFKNTSQRLIDALERSCKRTLTSLNLRIAHMTEISFNAWHEGMDGATPSADCIQSTEDSIDAVPPTLVFPSLTNLSMRGSCADLVGHTLTWSTPKLTSLTIDFEICRINNDRGISTILGSIGDQLTVLDIQAADINFDFHQILALCPNLENVSFDLAHWKTSSKPPPKLAPHTSLKKIGLHGLTKFFHLETWSYGDGTVDEVHINNFDLLLNRSHLPNLQTIRVLNIKLVEVIAKWDSQLAFTVVSERWKRWEKQCETHAVQLEDCTGRRLSSHYPLEM